MMSALERNPSDPLAPYRSAVDRGEVLRPFASKVGRNLLAQAMSIESCLGQDRNDSALSLALMFEWDVLLPGLLQVDDRCCSNFGMEGRSPFLDQDLAAKALSIPLPIKSPPDHVRSVFLKELGPLLPPPIARRDDKLGFPHPLLSWWRGPLHTWAKSLLEKAAARDKAVFDGDFIPAMLEDDGQGGRLVYFMVMLEFWQRAFTDQPLANLKKNRESNFPDLEVETR